MIRWLRRARQTHTPVHDESALQRERDSGLRLGYQALGAVQLLLQLLLWTVLTAYDQTVQATWQAVMMLAAPVAALWLVWRNAGAVQAGRDKTAAILAACLLLPCLLIDCWLLLRASKALLTDMIPMFPVWARVGIVTLFPLLTAWLGKGKGVAYAAYFMRFYLPVLFCLSTVLASADVEASRLWPLLGPGLPVTAWTALSGGGACWGVALLYLFPLGQKRAPQPRREGPAAALFLWLPLALCALWALWMGLVSPWRAGDELTIGQRMTGLSQLSANVLLGEAGALFWMSMLPIGLAGVVSGGEQLVRGMFPRLPRFLADALILLPGALLLVPDQPPAFLPALLPWRFIPSALCGAALIVLGRRGKA